MEQVDWGKEKKVYIIIFVCFVVIITAAIIASFYSPPSSQAFNCYYENRLGYLDITAKVSGDSLMLDITIAHEGGTINSYTSSMSIEEALEKKLIKKKWFFTEKGFHFFPHFKYIPQGDMILADTAIYQSTR